MHLDVEAYEVARNGGARASRNPASDDRCAGAAPLFVPMTQPAAGIVAAALEPDSPGSYVGAGLIPMAEDESEAPVYRVMDASGLVLWP